MPTANVARVGFSAPNLDGQGEQRFEAGDPIPADALTKKTLASLLEQGVIVKRDDADPPALGWAQGHTVVNGQVIQPEAEEA